MNCGGRVNFFGGIPKDRQPVPIDTNIVHYKELYLTGSTRTSVEQFRKTPGYIANGLIDVKSLAKRSLPIERAMEAFEYARKADGFKNIITFE